jgi:hypothetical protein
MSDDRLESLLRYLSEDEPCREFEKDLSQRQLQVYNNGKPNQEKEITWKER